MRPIQIIGIGSPLGLDRIGWAAVAALRARDLPGAFPAGTLALTEWDRPGSLLVEALGGAPGAILIDAMRAGDRPGNVRRLTAAQVLGAPQGFVSSHDVGVAQALALADALGALPRRTLVYGIEIGAGDVSAAGVGPSLDELCEQAVARLEPRLRADLGDWLASPTSA